MADSAIDLSAANLSWAQLTPAARQALCGKLEGLYGQTTAADAFTSLATDKQQALLLLWQRFAEFDLWPHVRRIENAYGLGGVGMNFAAWPSFSEILRWHPRFTARLAKRRNTDGGFRELRVCQGGLHLLYNGHGEARRWDAHFDRYNPLFSVGNTARHIWHEVLHSRAPDWTTVQGYLTSKK